MSDITPLLVIGFNRPEYVENRLQEAIAFDIPKIIVSIDGPEVSQLQIFSEVVSKYSKRKLLKNEIQFIFREKNLGMSEHVVMAISEVLKDYKSVIIVEDDIQMGENFYLSLKESLTNFGDEYFGISGFSPISFGSNLPNFWRESHYISIWGWGTSREGWSKYKFKLEEEDIEALEQSASWQALPKNEQKIWTRRFNKVLDNPKATWDSQVQFACFRYDLINLTSFFRQSENVGFDDTRSTNTKSRRPRVLGKFTLNNLRVRSFRIRRSHGGIFELLDKIVITGTIKVGIRGFRARLPKLKS